MSRQAGRQAGHWQDYPTPRKVKESELGPKTAQGAPGPSLLFPFFLLCDNRSLVMAMERRGEERRGKDGGFSVLSVQDCIKESWGLGKIQDVVGSAEASHVPACIEKNQGGSNFST